MKRVTGLLLFVVFALASFPAAASDDKAAVEQAVTDYVIGFYTGQPELLVKVLHPTLRKIGWMMAEDGSGYQGPFSMTWEQAKERAPEIPGMFGSSKTSPYEVMVFEVLDKTASAKVTALWGVDYFHLVKGDDGNWMIYNVIWQSLP